MNSAVPKPWTRWLPELGATPSNVSSTVPVSLSGPSPPARHKTVTAAGSFGPAYSLPPVFLDTVHQPPLGDELAQSAIEPSNPAHQQRGQQIAGRTGEQLRPASAQRSSPSSWPSRYSESAGLLAALRRRRRHWDRGSPLATNRRGSIPPL